MAGIGDNITIYPKSITFNSVAYSNTSGGPIQLTYSKDGSVLETRTGVDVYPQSVAVTDLSYRVTARLQTFGLDLVEGTTASLVGVATTAGGVDKTYTWTTMVLTKISGTQDRAQEGYSEYTFVHESADGTTDPLTIS